MSIFSYTLAYKQNNQ